MSDVVSPSRPLTALPPARTAATYKDVVALCKPGISMMAAITAAGTWLLSTLSFAPDALVRGAIGLIAVTMLVMGAGALNMVIERDVDALMTRTHDRPVVAGRLSPLFAATVGIGLVGVALPLMLVVGNALTLCLGMLSLFLYVFVYTPMKRTSPWSLVVGSVPGAMPALMGATLATGTIEITGAALFTLVFLWQLPHFLAISVYRQSEYEKAGHKVFSTTTTMTGMKSLIIGTAAPLCGLGVALWPLGVGGPVYAFIAVLVGVWFTVVCAQGFDVAKEGSRKSDDAWAKKAFIASLVWQTAIFFALAVDRVLFGLFA